ncbi:phosphoglycerate mutase-like protein [Protomyces lactucae-debilis]|uniref:Phosphoglycerate mutase-like protein n=1 Tax=Protomyces lactucae-debilis TaxID=2754530 RepID=A0A1Y2FJW3_PROLT|nr:phosphoglycerate mutase-like protein [Protomyces lactucae-debilis]ORY83664.1 phosphoglycerate mutase-like protein [Protomyces lactucae-debilis]
MTSLQGTLEGVVLLTRHGDRTRFYQNPEAGYAGTNTHITPLGEAQTYNTGQYIRSRYIDAKSSSQITGISVDTIDLAQLTVTCDAATEANVIVLSAYSMWQGIYPASPLSNVTLANGTLVTSPLGGQQYVPMETVEFEQSPLLEAFASCPAYTANLNAFYNSAEYTAKSALEKPFRDSLTTIVDGRNTTLKDMYNVYDFINVNQIYNATFKQELDNSTLAKASDLANWLSYRVFTGSSISSIGNVAGRGMMSQIIEAMADIADTTTPRKIKHYSLSYKPFLSLFNMTGAAQSAPELQAVPAYSSMAAFELRNISSELFINLVFRNGSDAGTQAVSYPILGQQQIKMSEFIATFNSSAIHSTLEWCKHQWLR